MADGRKHDRASIRRLHPRAWKPVEVFLVVDGRDTRFLVHPDGKVYKDSSHSVGGPGTVRRVNDETLRRAVLQALRGQQHRREQAGERRRALVEGVGKPDAGVSSRYPGRTDDAA